MRRVLLVSGGLALLGACRTLTPSYSEPELTGSARPPSDWRASLSGKTQEALMTGWLEDFGDRRLETFVREAVEANPDLQATAERLRIAKQRTIQTGADRFPQIRLNSGANRRERVETRTESVTSPASPMASPGAGTPDAGADGMLPAGMVDLAGAQPTAVTETRSYDVKEWRTDYDLALDLSWEIDVWGRLRNRTRASGAEFQAAAEDYASARLSLAANVAKAWFNLTESERLVELAASTVKSFEGNLQVLEGNFEKGINGITGLDISLSRANVAAAKSSLQNRARDRDRARRSLETLLGRYPAAQVPSADALPNLRRDIPVGLPSELLLRRPDILAAERRYAAAIERVAEAKKALLPSVRITGATGTTTTDFAKLLNQELFLSSVAASVTQSIFEGGRLRANIEISKAQQRELAATYTSIALTAFREVEIALAAERYLEAQIEALKVAAKESVTAETLALQQFGRQLVNTTTVLDSQRRAFEAQTSLIQAENQRLQNRVDLYLALGGDFETRVQPPIGPARVE
ncbi:MAG: efflux transporter outer membrane subunit, partial [Verrucomicrobiales bacterium]